MLNWGTAAGWIVRSVRTKLGKTDIVEVDLLDFMTICNAWPDEH